MPAEVLDAPHAQYLRGQQRGMLATVAPNGAPQNKPVGFRYDAERGTIEISGTDMERSAKFRNIAVHPQVAFTVQDVPDSGAGADGVRFMEIRGTAEQVDVESSQPSHLSDWIIRIHPRRVVSWNVAGPGMHSADLPGDPAVADGGRAAVGMTGAAAERAQAAVEHQVSELQAGLGDHDAERYNHHFADDVMGAAPMAPLSTATTPCTRSTSGCMHPVSTAAPVTRSCAC